MPIEVLMPALSPTMTEGNLAKWHKKEGDPVKSGDVIAEIETDKATMEVEAVDEGRMGKIVVPEGAQGVKVNEVIALILEEGEDAAALAGSGKGAAAKAPPAPASTAETAKRAPAPAPESPKTAPPPVAAARAGGNGADHGGRLFASPLARRMAQQAGIDLSQLKGSGPQGRIVKADVEAALGQPGAAREAGAGPGCARCGRTRSGGAATDRRSLLRQAAGGRGGGQYPLCRDPAYRHAADDRAPHGGIEAERPAFQPYRRLRDRRPLENAGRAQRQVERLQDFGQRFRDPRRGAHHAQGAARQRLLERRGGAAMAAGRYRRRRRARGRAHHPHRQAR